MWFFFFFFFFFFGGGGGDTLPVVFDKMLHNSHIQLHSEHFGWARSGLISLNREEISRLLRLHFCINRVTYGFVKAHQERCLSYSYANIYYGFRLTQKNKMNITVEKHLYIDLPLKIRVSAAL